MSNQEYKKLEMSVVSTQPNHLTHNSTRPKVEQIITRPLRWIVIYHAECEDSTGIYVETWTIQTATREIFHTSILLQSIYNVFLKSMEESSARVLVTGWTAYPRTMGNTKRHYKGAREYITINL